MADALSKDYDFGPKNHWRRTQWNFFTHHCHKHKVPLKSSFGIYLTDKDDIDRSVAVSKGFASENLIGINWDNSTCRLVRSDGFAVKGDLGWQVLSWDKPKLNFIAADFSGGLRNSQMLFLEALVRTHGLSENSCAVSINLLRGRDEESKEFRKLLADNKRMTTRHPKHRGVMAWEYYVAQCLIAIEDFASLNPEQSAIVAKDRDVIFRDIQTILRLVCSPRFGTYPTGNGKKMDWVMFKAEGFMKYLGAGIQFLPNSPGHDSIKSNKRNRSAAMAHRTRTLN